MQTLKKIALGIACAFGALMCLALFIGIVTGGTKNTTSKPDTVVNEAPIVTPAPYFPKTQPPAPAPVPTSVPAPPKKDIKVPPQGDSWYYYMLNQPNEKRVHYDSWYEALADGHHICQMQLDGASFEEVTIDRLNHNPHNFTPTQIGYQIGGADGAWCPQFLPNN